MTRETKIGLLVGLAFIIVVAILLAEHASSTGAPRAAALGESAGNVRDGVNAPGTAPAAPVSPIQTRADIAQPPRQPSGPRVEDVHVGPGPSSPLAINGRDAGTSVGGGGVTPLPPPPARGNGRGSSPADLLDQHPGDFVAVGETARGTPPGGRKPATLPVTAPKTYVAEPGDTVSKIALKMMGANSKANREALVKANPNLQGEGNVVYVGKTYTIPSAGATQQAGEPPRPPVVPPFTPAPAGPPAVAGTTWYTVRENDNLWRIAQRELGDGNQWTNIRDLNKDVLKGGETVKAQMRIRLPKAGSATASTN